MKKTYVSKTGIKLTFPVKVAGKVKFISLDGTKGDLTTGNVDLQNAIEESSRFKLGEIVLIDGEPNKHTIKEEPEPDIPEDVTEETPNNTPADETGDTSSKESEVTEDDSRTTSYPEVTDYQTAASVLRKLGVPHQSVRTPANIAKKAGELGVVFPNLA